MKPVSRLRGQLAEASRERGPQVLLGLLRRGGAEELRVILFLEQHGHEPVLEPQLAHPEDAAAEAVVLEPALAREHGVADTGAAGERVVEGLDEAARGLDQHAVAHRHHRGHARLQQLGGDRLGRLLGLRGLAGLQEHERDAVMAQQRAELAGEDGEVPAPVELDDVLRVLEAEPPEADGAVIDAVAVEVDDVVGLAGAAGAVELLAQGGQCGRAEQAQANEAAQRLHRLDQRQGAGAVVDVAAGLVLGPRADEQDADGGGEHRHVEVPRVRQAPAHAGGLRALEQEAVAVVEQLPRQAEQQGGGLPSGLHLGLGGAVFERRIDVDGEAAPGLRVDARPGVQDVRGVGDRHRRLVEEPTPLHEARLDLAGAVPERPRSARWRTSPDTSATPPPRSGRGGQRNASSSRSRPHAAPRWRAHRRAGREQRRGARRLARGT